MTDINQGANKSKTILQKQDVLSVYLNYIKKKAFDLVREVFPKEVAVELETEGGIDII